MTYAALSSTTMGSSFQHQNTLQHFRIIPHMALSSTKALFQHQGTFPAPRHFPARPNTQHGTSQRLDGTFQHPSTKLKHCTFQHLQISSTLQHLMVIWRCPAPKKIMQTKIVSSTKLKYDGISHKRFPALNCLYGTVQHKKKQTNWVHSSTNGVALSSTNPVENYMPRISQHREHCYYKKKHLMDPKSFRFGAGLFHGQAGH